MSRIFEVGQDRSAATTATGEIRRRYCGLGYSDEESVTASMMSWLDAASLLTLNLLVLDEIDCREISEGNWLLDVTWRTFELKVPTTAAPDWASSVPEYNFSLALTNEKVLVPLTTQTVYQRIDDTEPLPEIALIGDQGDGHPAEGADILVPEISFGIKRYLKKTYWTESLANDFLRLIGRVNDSPFGSWDAGEVLCAGITGAVRGRSDMELNFVFRVRQNSTVEVDGFDSFDKEGWQYVWPRHQVIVDSNNNLVTTAKIDYLVLSDVYPKTSFSLMV